MDLNNMYLALCEACMGIISLNDRSYILSKLPEVKEVKKLYYNWNRS